MSKKAQQGAPAGYHQVLRYTHKVFLCERLRNLWLVVVKVPQSNSAERKSDIVMITMLLLTAAYMPYMHVQFHFTIVDPYGFGCAQLSHSRTCNLSVRSGLA